MDSKTPEITHDFQPFFCVYSDGSVHRYIQHDFVPPGEDSHTGVISKDVIISPENNVSARIYLPNNTGDKHPLLIFIHGGAFTVQSAFSSIYHCYVNSLAYSTRSVVVSIEYRLAPENPIPACYDDCSAAVKWIGSHVISGKGPDPWLNDYVDFRRVYAAGDSAGANLASYIATGARHADLGFKFSGIILVHPFFGMGKRDKLWEYICAEETGRDDPRLNPAADPGFPANLACEALLVCVAQEDFLKDRGQKYFEAVKQGNWKGAAELFETPGVHVFFLFDSSSEDAASLMNRIVEFIHGGPPQVRALI